MPRFRLMLTDATILTATVLAWRRQLASLVGKVPNTRTTQALKWASDLVGGDGEFGGYSYALVPEGDHAAVALVELTHAFPGHPNARLKVLRIHVEPRLDVAAIAGDPPLIELAQIAATILTEVLGLTFDELPAAQMRVWGSSPLTRDFLAATAAHLLDSANMKVHLEGAWLVIES